MPESPDAAEAREASPWNLLEGSRALRTPLCGTSSLQNGEKVLPCGRNLSGCGALLRYFPSLRGTCGSPWLPFNQPPQQSESPSEADVKITFHSVTQPTVTEPRLRAGGPR